MIWLGSAREDLVRGTVRGGDGGMGWDGMGEVDGWIVGIFGFLGVGWGGVGWGL